MCVYMSDLYWTLEAAESSVESNNNNLNGMCQSTIREKRVAGYYH